MDPRITEVFRKFGKKGAKARQKNVSAKRRKQIAKKAARARWRKK
jgi:hypothetical protein